MPDREKVIAWLADEELYYRDHGDLHNSKMACDALSMLKDQEEEIENLKQTAQSRMEGICLLKEQEAVEPRRIDGKRNHFNKCGNCNYDLMTGVPVLSTLRKEGEVEWLTGRRLSMTLDGAFAMFHMRVRSVLVMEKSVV